MRLSRDEAFRLIDAFDLWIHEQVGEDVKVTRGLEEFSVRVLRAKARGPRQPPPLETAVERERVLIHA